MAGGLLVSVGQVYRETFVVIHQWQVSDRHIIQFVFLIA